KRNRVGRGSSSGNGKTAGRGQKGQKARNTPGPYPWFEGGQTPLFQTLPKRRFTNINRKEYAIVNLDTLNQFYEHTEIIRELLFESVIVQKIKSISKLFAIGMVDCKLTVKAHRLARAAQQAFDAAGGSVEEILYEQIA